jgi:hypothetical protein
MHNYPKCFLCKNHAVIHPAIEGNDFGQLQSVKADGRETCEIIYPYCRE